MRREVHRSAFAALAFASALLGCAGRESRPAYSYSFEYLANRPPTDRARHVQRVLEDREAGEPLVLLGRELGPYGATAAVARLSQGFFMVDLPGAEKAIARIYDAGVPGAEVPTFELALAASALESALQNRVMGWWRNEGLPVAGKSRRDLIEALGGLAAALASRQEEDGSWGGPVETAWTLLALTGAAESSPIVRARMGEGWRRAGGAILARWMGDRGLSIVDRLHRAAAMRLAERITAADAPGPGAAWYQRQFRGLDPGRDPDAWLAAGFLWMVLGPSADPDHPLQGCKGLLREAYAAGEVRTDRAGGTFAMALAIESFGWDAFGSVIGYLRVADWPTLEER